MMNVFWHELRAYRKSTIVWAISLSMIAIVFLGMLPSFSRDVETSQKIIANLPLVLRESFGISAQSFFTVLGFFSYLLSVVGAAAAIQAVNLGLGVIAKEESGKTADFLLTKPLSRASIVTSKLAAVFCCIAMTNIVFVVASYSAARLYSTAQFSGSTFLLIALTIFLIQIVFVAIGAFCAVMLPRVTSVVSVSIPLVFSFFIVGTLGAILGNDTMRYITPLKYYDSQYILAHNSYELKFVGIEAAVVIVLVAATYVLFIRKDIRAGA